MTTNTYLVHYGVKGMKWGVRRDRRAANKARRRAEKEFYKRELAAPGSQSKEAISTKRLSSKKVKNIAGMALLGREAIADAYSLGVLGVTASQAMAAGTSAAVVGQALIPMALGVGGVGVAAGVGTVALAKRVKSINTSMTLRDNPKDPKAKAKAAKITSERAAKEQKRRTKVEKKNKKRAIKQLRKDPGGRQAYDMTERIAKQLGRDVDVDVDDLGRITRMYVK